MSKKDFKEYICRPFCMIFREGQKEEMACQAALAIEALVGKGRLDPLNMPRSGKHAALWQSRDTAIEQSVCSRCPFRAEDCDYHSENPPENCEPCGGYIVLALLHRSGGIDETDISRCFETHRETAGAG